MSEIRSERVIAGDARLEWGRSPVVAVVVVGFLLAAIVGIASAASPWVANDAGESAAPAFVGRLLAVALAAGLCILLALAWIHLPRRTKVTRKRGGGAVITEGLGSNVRIGTVVLVGGVLLLVLLVLAFWFLLEQADLASPPPLPAATTAGEAVLPPPPAPAASASPVFDWFLVALLGSIAVVAPLVFIARRRLRTTDAVPDVDDGTESVVRAVGDSIDQIEQDPDARRAIIRAYAQMEHAFDDAGIPRQPAEAPFEYLGRALRGLRVSPPAAGRLATLFERARFSQHAAGTDTKQEALGALREVEREMRE